MRVILESRLTNSAQQMDELQLSESCVWEWLFDVSEESTVPKHESQGLAKHANGCSRNKTRIMRATIFIFCLGSIMLTNTPDC
jgi:hypothetical protein